MFNIFEVIKNILSFNIFKLLQQFYVARLWDFIKKTVLVLVGVVAALFVVYFWNLDQKLLGWAYKQVNLIFDQKKVDQVF
jgi:hypothetical protein